MSVLIYEVLKPFKKDVHRLICECGFDGKPWEYEKAYKIFVECPQCSRKFIKDTETGCLYLI
jgi:hypothetical protein